MTRLVAVSGASGGLAAFLVSSAQLLLQDIELLLLGLEERALARLAARPISWRSAAICAAVSADCSDVDLGAAGLKKNWPVSAEFSQGTCLPAVDASTSLRTSIITSLMLAPSVVDVAEKRRGEGAVATLAVKGDVAGLGGEGDHHADGLLDLRKAAADLLASGSWWARLRRQRIVAAGVEEHD